MNTYPTLYSERLMLRPFHLDDAPDIQRLAGDKEIALKTENIPHPYEKSHAEEWIRTHQEKFDKQEEISWAIAHREQSHLIGTIGIINIHSEYELAEIGYWIGKPFWGRGYCSEAGHAVLEYAFTSLELIRVCAAHFKSNHASGRVMQKLGMSYEGCLRSHVKRMGFYHDLVFYGILKDEYAKYI